MRVPARAVAEQFALLDLPDLAPRYNIAPSQPVAALRLMAGQPHRQLVLLRWGLIPSWADNPAVGNRLINARAETAADRPAFRTALRRRRCLIVADGFFEWRAVEKGGPPSSEKRPRAALRRQRYFIRLRDNRPFGFAGLWETWQPREKAKVPPAENPNPQIHKSPNPFSPPPAPAAIESCTILTTEANELVRPIHDRMPVIIDAADYDLWLDPAVTQPEPLVKLLRPYPSRQMTAHAVSTLVNSPAHDDPRCIEPAEGEGGGASLF